MKKAISISALFIAAVFAFISGGCVDDQREWVEDLYLTTSAVEHKQDVNTTKLEKRLGKPDAVMSLQEFEQAVPNNQPRRAVVLADVKKCFDAHNDKSIWVYDETRRYLKPLPFPVLFGQDTEYHCAVFTIVSVHSKKNF